MRRHISSGGGGSGLLLRRNRSADGRRRKRDRHGLPQDLEQKAAGSRLVTPLVTRVLAPPHLVQLAARGLLRRRQLLALVAPHAEAVVDAQSRRRGCCQDVLTVWAPGERRRVGHFRLRHFALLIVVPKLDEAEERAEASQSEE